MQNKVPNGPSRTPRPAHPAELAADRLQAIIRSHYDTTLTSKDVQVLDEACLILWRIVREDEK